MIYTNNAECEIIFLRSSLFNRTGRKISSLNETLDSSPSGSYVHNYKESNDKKREGRKEKERQNNFKKNDKLMEAAYSKCEDNLVDMYVNPEHYSNLSKRRVQKKI